MRTMDREGRALGPSSSGFKTHGTHKNKPTQYVKKKGDVDFLVACLYVDDMIYMWSSELIIAEFKFSMMRKF